MTIHRNLTRRDILGLTLAAGGLGFANSLHACVRHSARQAGEEQREPG